jgi:hypothetical protein
VTPRFQQAAGVKTRVCVQGCFFVDLQRGCFVDELMHALRLELYMPYVLLLRRHATVTSSW